MFLHFDSAEFIDFFSWQDWWSKDLESYSRQSKEEIESSLITFSAFCSASQSKMRDELRSLYL